MELEQWTKDLRSSAGDVAEGDDGDSCGSSDSDGAHDAEAAGSDHDEKVLLHAVQHANEIEPQALNLKLSCFHAFPILPRLPPQSTQNDTSMLSTGGKEGVIEMSMVF